ncbi:type I restriction endonuclease subunit R, EcoR124 family [Gallibacterium genomosp. 3]|uniref:type I restriction endonuclease subunit R, EcoR124 family n=1 Tax=Gallibacterium genomosp. 3 TaxID=505345 RepID=UPI003D7B82C4
MFAVSSVDAAKLYYEIFKDLQKDSPNPLRIATIFSFAANEEQNAKGEIADENFEPTAMDSSAKEFLQAAINDYNAYFQTNYGVESNGFQNYYRDLAKRVKNQEIDLLIVVGMFLTGFDAPCLNTLFVDKNLRYHGLIQAYSRTNRIFDKTKPFGNIVTFRDLEQATIDAIKLFGNANTRKVVLEKSYEAYMNGYTDEITGDVCRGYLAVVKELTSRFPDPANIETEADKKEFIKLFGEYLRIDNILQNYDEYVDLRKASEIQLVDDKLNEENGHYSSVSVPTLSEHLIQDYRSTYNDIRDWLRRQKTEGDKGQSTIDWSDVVFEVDLLKSQEINLDYILTLIFEQNQKTQNKPALISDIRKIIRASVGNRAKEGLIVDFIHQTNLDQIKDKASIIDEFFKFAQREQQKAAKELIIGEQLREEAAKRYLTASLKREYASENGTELNEVLPKLSPLDPEYRTKKQTVFQKIVAFVEKFKGIGGKL